jgi:hypothetical protein
MFMLLFDYGNSMDEEGNLFLINIMLEGPFEPGGLQIFRKSLLTISVLNILASIGLHVQLERYRNQSEHNTLTKAYSLNSWRGLCLISILFALFLLAFPIMNLRSKGVLVFFTFFDIVPIMSIVNNANIVNYARNQLFRWNKKNY